METSFGLLKAFTSDPQGYTHLHPHGSRVGLSEVTVSQAGQSGLTPKTGVGIVNIMSHGEEGQLGLQLR